VNKREGTFDSKKICAQYYSSCIFCSILWLQVWNRFFGRTVSEGRTKPAFRERQEGDKVLQESSRIEPIGLNSLFKKIMTFEPFREEEGLNKYRSSF
jgi:hypothetical protein